MKQKLLDFFYPGQAGGAARPHGTENRSINYFVGHKPPEFALWPNFSYYSPENSTKQAALPDPRLGESWRFSEYASLFLLRREIDTRALQDNETVTIAQYRRFTLTHNLGPSANGLEWTRIIHPDDKRISELHLQTRPNAGLNLLIPRPMKFNEPAGLLSHYASVHPIRDLLRFTACLVDHNILSAPQAEKFLIQSQLIPAPTCSTTPVCLFLHLYDTLERAALYYLNDGYINHNDPYQARSCAFLLERLHSYLLFRHLEDQQITTHKIFGFLTVIAEENTLKSSTADGTLIDRTKQTTLSQTSQ